MKNDPHARLASNSAQPLKAVIAKANLLAGALAAAMLLAAGGSPASAQGACSSGVHGVNNGNGLTTQYCQANAHGAAGGLVIGLNAETWSENNTAIGTSAYASATAASSFGAAASANSPDATAVGYDARATYSSATAIGARSRASGGTALGGRAQAGTYSVAVGELAKANANYETSVGGFTGVDAAAEGATRIGYQAGYSAAGIYSIAIGAGPASIITTQAAGNYSIAIGSGNTGTNVGARANRNFGVAIGTSALAEGERTVAIGAFAGAGAGASTAFNTFIGDETGINARGVGHTMVGLAAGDNIGGTLNSAFGNSAGQNSSGSRNLAVGVASGTAVTGDYNTALGDSAGAKVTGNHNVALGHNAGRNMGANGTVAIGDEARANANSAVALGRESRASAQGAVAIGFGSIGNVANAVSVGTPESRRRIINVARAVNANDAVTLGQVRSMIDAATVGAMAPAASGTTATSEAGEDAADEGETRPVWSSFENDGGGAGGPQDDTGDAPAPALPPAIVAWANVDSDGSLTGARSVAGEVRHSRGHYEIAFDRRSLRQCTFNATLGNVGFIAVTPGEYANSVNVETRNPRGALMDASFYLMAVC